MIVLDHGYVSLIDTMGDDSTPAESFDTKKRPEEFINFLLEARPQHLSPLEQLEAKFEVKAPLFVARQWVRHRTASICEWSGRYRKMHPEYYVDSRLPAHAQESIREVSEAALAIYNGLLSDGIAKESARVVLGTNFYTTWVWKIDLKNLLHFLDLRMDAHAQWEIRQYALAMGRQVAHWVPVIWDVYQRERLYV